MIFVIDCRFYFCILSLGEVEVILITLERITWFQSFVAVTISRQIKVILFLG